MSIIAALVCLCTFPAVAAAQGVPRSEMVLGGQTLAVPSSEMQRLSDLGRTRTMSRSFQERALAAAERVVRSRDGLYVLGLYQLELARQWNDDALRLRALDVLIGYPSTPPDKLAGYLEMRAGIFYRAGDHAAAAALFARVLALQPDNPQAMMNLAQAQLGSGDAAGAIALVRRAIAAPRPGAAAIPESWYRQWQSIAFNGRLREEGVAAAQALVAAYPSADNWRSALIVYRQLAEPQGEAEIALYRLMRMAGVMTRADEYQRYAQLLLHAGAPTEARAVLEDGIARGIVARSAAPIPAILAEIDRSIARSVPPARIDGELAAIRTAAGQAEAGRRAEAAAAFRRLADTGTTPSAEIARFWLTWLAQAG